MHTERSESVREEYTSPTTVPVNPNERVFNQLEGKRIHQVVCSASATFCVASDDAIGNSLGSKLYECIKEASLKSYTSICSSHMPITSANLLNLNSHCLNV